MPTKAEYLQEFNDLWDKYADVLPERRAGYKLPENIDYNLLRTGIVWFRDVCATKGMKALKIWRLKSPGYWETLGQMGADDFTEVVLLRKAKHALKQAVTSQKRPGVFKVTVRKK